MKTGILLINLGTPKSPSYRHVYEYLTEFLNDPYVIDLGALKRFFLVNFIIVPFRASNSARLYKKIWTKEVKSSSGDFPPEADPPLAEGVAEATRAGTPLPSGGAGGGLGSPLLIHGLALKNKLQEKLGGGFAVELAMRYQQPSIGAALQNLSRQNLSQIIVIPLYPQYAASSTLSTIEKVKKIALKYSNLPKLQFIEQFYDHPLFIKAWVHKAEKYQISQYDHVLFSFHGLPERHLKKLHGNGSCADYHCEKEVNDKNGYCYKAACFETARLIANQLNLKPDDYTVSFQSRLGKEEWIKPYSDHVIVEKAKAGIKTMLVFSPAFVADCLETLYEISVEYQELFKENGGERIQLVEGLNTDDLWVSALEDIISGHF